MSRANPQDYVILNERKFGEMCSILGIKEQCCLDPERKVIEKAFRKNALKCHPDKGGDPVIFKKLNDAYYKLIGHIHKLEQQAEAAELNNSILIEISKTAVVKWQEKLKTRYGWFKTNNCKNIIFDGPYKQYMGRSKYTGNITVVLYEDPPDQIAKIHVRSSKYMAWIAEMMLPSHLHVDKNKTIQFDQWRLAHLAEFGIYYFSDAPRTPAPPRKEPAAREPSSTTSTTTPKTPAGKRRQARQREAAEKKAKEAENSSEMPKEEEEDTEVKKEQKPDSCNGQTAHTDDNNNVTSTDKQSETDKTSDEPSNKDESDKSVKIEKTLNEHKEGNEHSEEILTVKIDNNVYEGDIKNTKDTTADAFLKSNSLFESNSETQKNSSNKETGEITGIPCQTGTKDTPGDHNSVHKSNGDIITGSDHEGTEHSTINGPTGNIQHSTQSKTTPKKDSFSCDLCDKSFLTLIEHNLHKKVCFPVPDFLSSGMEDVIDTEYRKSNGTKINEEYLQFICELCNEKFTNMVWLTKHRNNCQVQKIATKNCPGDEEEIPKQNLEDVNNNKSDSIDKQNEVPESINVKPGTVTELKAAEADTNHNIPKSKTEGNSADDTNEESDEVKNVHKNYEKIVENSGPTPLKTEEAICGANEANKKDFKSVNRKSAMKPTTNSGGKKTVGSESKKSSDKKTEHSLLVNKDKDKSVKTKHSNIDDKTVESLSIKSPEAERKDPQPSKLVAKDTAKLTPKKTKDVGKKTIEPESPKPSDKQDGKACDSKLVDKDSSKQKAGTTKNKDKTVKNVEEKSTNLRKEQEKKIEVKDKEDKCKNEGISSVSSVSSVNTNLDVGALNLSSNISTNILNNGERASQASEEELKHGTNLLTKVRQDKNDPGKETVEVDPEAIRISNIILTKGTKETSEQTKKPDPNLEVNSKPGTGKTSQDLERPGISNSKTQTSETRNETVNGDLTRNNNTVSENLTRNNNTVSENLTRNNNTVSESLTRNNNTVSENLTRNNNTVSENLTRNNNTVSENLTRNNNTVSENLTRNNNTVSENLTRNNNTVSENLTRNNNTVSENLTRNNNTVSENLTRNNNTVSENLTRNNNTVSENLTRNNHTVSENLTRNNEDCESLSKSNLTKVRTGSQTKTPAPNQQSSESIKFVSDEIYRDSSSRRLVVDKDKSSLDKEIEALDRKHAAKLERINENQRERKIDLSKTDVNTNRPSILGPSRFEASSYSNYRPSGPSEGPRRAEGGDARSHLLSRSVTAATVNSLNTPELSRKRFDSNFNAVPEPFKSHSKSNISESSHNVPSLSSSKLSVKPPLPAAPESSYQAPLQTPLLSSYSALSSLPSPANYTGPYSATLSTRASPTIPSTSTNSSFTSSPSTSSFTSSSTLTKSTGSRAKSEGTGLAGSSQYKDFYHQIQASKDRYKSDVEKAMNFDRTAIKPPIIREKLPRPDATPLIARRDLKGRQDRRQEREATVISAIVSERARRGKSDDLLRTSSSFRF